MQHKISVEVWDRYVKDHPDESDDLGRFEIARKRNKTHATVVELAIFHAQAFHGVSLIDLDLAVMGKESAFYADRNSDADVWPMQVKCNVMPYKKGKSKKPAKRYYLPTDRGYAQVKINRDEGDMLLSSAAEAEAQGFTRV